MIRQARSLGALDRQVQELLGPASVDYEFHTGDAELDRLARHVRTARSTARMFEVRARRLTERVLSLPSGGSVRDLAVLLELSHQRVQQLMERNGRAVGKGKVK